MKKSLKVKIVDYADAKASSEHWSGVADELKGGIINEMADANLTTLTFEEADSNYTCTLVRPEVIEVDDDKFMAKLKRKGISITAAYDREVVYTRNDAKVASLIADGKIKATDVPSSTKPRNPYIRVTVK